MTTLAEATSTSSPVGPLHVPLQIDARYVVQTAKNNIVGLTQVVGEAVTNADQAITDRCVRDGTDNIGKIDLFYDPDSKELRVWDDGIGLVAEKIRRRLGNVGGAPQSGAKRSFFDRGIREVLIALNGGEFHSVGRNDAGDLVYSAAQFDPIKGIALISEDVPVKSAPLAMVGLLGDRTNSVTVIPMAVFADQKPKLYEFGDMRRYIEDCVQIRPVLLDTNRTVSLHYGTEPPRVIRYNYEAGEVLIADAPVTIGSLTGTLWVRAASAPIKSLWGKQLRRNGILIRGERAAYEVTAGLKLKSQPGMAMLFGELRLDGIEDQQRKDDEARDLKAQLIYKADRSGLNPEHPLVEEIYSFIDNKLAPLVEEVEKRAPQRTVAPDMRRQLAKLANLINQQIDKSDTDTDIRIPDNPEEVPDGPPDHPNPDGPAPTPPTPAPRARRVLSAPLEFPRSRALLEAGEGRVLELWVDPKAIPPGTPLRRACRANEVVRSVLLQHVEVPPPDWDDVSMVRIKVVAGDTEGRFELAVAAGGMPPATMGVHVRFPRITGFISNIDLSEDDWESGGAVYNAKTGRVTVYVGRPEFRDAEKRALKEGVKDPMKYVPYRQLIAESVLEAAGLPAAARRAEVDWDDLGPEERRDPMTLHNMVLFHYYALHYKLRHVLHASFSVAV